MKIPTPILIKKLETPIARNWWAGQPMYDDLTEVEAIMREAAAQLKWFLNKVDEKEKVSQNV